jgi:hypothetical protein
MIGGPKLEAGQRVGQFIVDHYIGQSTVHPVKAVILSKDHHWYHVTCDCGTEETQTQQQLTDKRRTHACGDCLKKGIET